MTQAFPGSRNAQDGPWATDKEPWGLESAEPRGSPNHTGGHSTWSTVPAETRGQRALRFQPRAKAQRLAGRLWPRPGSLQRQRVCPPGTFVQTLGSGTVRAYTEHSVRQSRSVSTARSARTVPQGPPVRDPEAVLPEHRHPGWLWGSGPQCSPAFRARWRPMRPHPSRAQISPPGSIAQADTHFLSSVSH